MTRRRCVGPSVLALLAVAVGVARAQSDATPLVGPFTRETYPQAVIDRPLTLPAGMVEVEMGWQFSSLHFETPVFGVNGIDDWDEDVTLRVGVTDRFQIEAGTAFSLDHQIHGEFQGTNPPDLRPSLTSWDRVVPLRLSFLALDTDALDTALTLTLPFSARSERFVIFSRFGKVVASTDPRVLPAVALAAPTRWRLCDWAWLQAGENLFAVTTGRGIASFAFDLGVGVQPHRMLAATLDTRIARVAFDGSGHSASRTLADAGSLDFETVFSPLPWLDFVGSVGIPDVGRGVDDYTTRFAVRVRI